MLHHFPHQAIDGRWHVVTRCPYTDALQSVDDFLSEHEARADAGSRNVHRGAQTSHSERSGGHSSNPNAVSRLFHGSLQGERRVSGGGVALTELKRLPGASTRSGSQASTNSASSKVAA